MTQRERNFSSNDSLGPLPSRALAKIAAATLDRDAVLQERAART